MYDRFNGDALTKSNYKNAMPQDIMYRKPPGTQTMHHPQSTTPEPHDNKHHIPHNSASPAAPTANAAPTTLTRGPLVGAGASEALLTMLASAAPMLEK